MSETIRTARDLIENGSPDGWPASMDDFYRLCEEGDLVTILARGCYSDPFSHYPTTIGEHIRTILRVNREAAVAEAVRAERERCAKIADQEATKHFGKRTDQVRSVVACQEIAAAIREEKP